MKREIPSTFDAWMDGKERSEKEERNP